MMQGIGHHGFFPLLFSLTNCVCVFFFSFISNKKKYDRLILVVYGCFSCKPVWDVHANPVPPAHTPQHVNATCNNV